MTAPVPPAGLNLTDSIPEPFCAPRLQPLQDYILVRPVERKQSDVLLVVSDEKFNRGVVVAVGSGERMTKRFHEGGNTWRTEETGITREMEVKPGDQIIYGDGALDYMYPRYFEAGVEYRVLQDKDVCMVVESFT
jgi:co-chaperonin GroES (HSP10)